MTGQFQETSMFCKASVYLLPVIRPANKYLFVKILMLLIVHAVL